MKYDLAKKRAKKIETRNSRVSTYFGPILQDDLFVYSLVSQTCKQIEQSEQQEDCPDDRTQPVRLEKENLNQGDGDEHDPHADVHPCLMQSPDRIIGRTTIFQAEHDG